MGRTHLLVIAYRRSSMYGGDAEQGGVRSATDLIRQPVAVDCGLRDRARRRGSTDADRDLCNPRADVCRGSHAKSDTDSKSNPHTDAHAQSGTDAYA
jgi:hypothetical protein